MTFKYACFALSALVIAAAPAQAGLTGQSFSAAYHYPDEGTVYGGATVPADFTVGAGVEGVIDVESVTDISFDFDNLSLVIDFATVAASPTWNATAFNGIIFTSATPLNISGASVLSSTIGFDNSRLTVTGNQIKLNWAGLGYADGSKIRIAFSAVPEAATWAMMIAGMGFVGAAMRRQRRAAATVRFV